MEKATLHSGGICMRLAPCGDRSTHRQHGVVGFYAKEFISTRQQANLCYTLYNGGIFLCSAQQFQLGPAALGSLLTETSSRDGGRKLFLWRPNNGSMNLSIFGCGQIRIPPALIPHDDIYPSGRAFVSPSTAVGQLRQGEYILNN